MHGVQAVVHVCVHVSMLLSTSEDARTPARASLGFGRASKLTRVRIIEPAPHTKRLQARATRSKQKHVNYRIRHAHAMDMSRHAVYLCSKTH